MSGRLAGRCAGRRAHSHSLQGAPAQAPPPSLQPPDREGPEVRPLSVPLDPLGPSAPLLSAQAPLRRRWPDTKG